MTRVSKKYESKTKMEQEQWLQLKKLFLFGYNLKIVLWWGELIFNHEGFTVNNINCIVWESNLSIRTQK